MSNGTEKLSPAMIDASAPPAPPTHEGPPAAQSAAPVKRLWRSLEELADTPEFRRKLGDEFADGVTDAPDGISRRDVLKVMGASVALAGVVGCTRKEDEHIAPYVAQPEGMTPGRPLFYASAMTLGGYAQGVLVESNEGRPTKIEGNPDHPDSLGASDVFMQASLLTMYDPDRSQVVRQADVVKDWDAFLTALMPRLVADRAQGNSGIRILTESVSSPTLVAQIAELKKKFSGAKWHSFDPLQAGNDRSALAGLTARYDFSRARVIVSLDSDFLQDSPGHLKYSRQFIDGRRIRRDTTDMNRLYVIESARTITGSMADHRWGVRPSVIPMIAASLARSLGVAGVDVPSGAAIGLDEQILAAVADDLKAAGSSALVIAGEWQSPAVHAAAARINQLLGSIGTTVFYESPVLATADGSLEELLADMASGAAGLLLILGGNPAYNAPIDLDFSGRLRDFSLARAANGSLKNFTARLGLYEDETSELCQWHLPETHYLEHWSDALATDGSAAIVQPLIQPLYAGRSSHELLAMLISNQGQRGYEIVRAYWAKNLPGDFETQWRSAIEKGIIAGTARTAPRPVDFTQVLPAVAAPDAGRGTFELTFRADPSVRDGFFANNSWLQELPKPLTKLCWDNAAYISGNSATKLDVSNGDLISIEVDSRQLKIPVWIVPGQPDGVIGLHLGYGRRRGGRVQAEIGFDTYQLRTRSNPWFATGAKATKLGSKHQLVAIHTYQTTSDRKLVNLLKADVVDRPASPGHEPEAKDQLDNRKLIRTATIEQFRKEPDFAPNMDESRRHELTLYPGFDKIYDQNLRWAMSIDLQSCIGCNACIIACQAENNIAVVGKDQVSRGRDLHWLRVDTYYAGETDNPEVYHQPIPCMQCENAPCELVCPVAATVHDNEGLNDMVYNRCVGTRYCSNNCPYKVRRFNFYQYADTDQFVPAQDGASMKLMRNPEVTVRSRGIMEKCTYCIQRITKTRVELEKVQVRSEEEARQLATPEARSAVLQRSAQTRQDILDQLQTACQQSCPTQAIGFGNINPKMEPATTADQPHYSSVSLLKNQPHDYTLLADLTTKPRTSYLARIVNPNPRLQVSDTAKAGA